MIRLEQISIEIFSVSKQTQFLDGSVRTKKHAKISTFSSNYKNDLNVFEFAHTLETILINTVCDFCVIMTKI